MERGDIIRVLPEHDWAGCLMTIEEVKSFGCMARMVLPLQGVTYIRLESKDFEIINIEYI